MQPLSSYCETCLQPPTLIWPPLTEEDTRGGGGQGTQMDFRFSRLDIFANFSIWCTMKHNNFQCLPLCQDGRGRGRRYLVCVKVKKDWKLPLWNALLCSKEGWTIVTKYSTYNRKKICNKCYTAWSSWTQTRSCKESRRPAADSIYFPSQLKGPNSLIA